MDVRRFNESVARNVRRAIAATGNTPDSVAAATHLDPAALNARLDNVEEFSVPELIKVGGFLRVHPKSLLEGALA